VTRGEFEIPDPYQKTHNERGGMLNTKFLRRTRITQHIVPQLGVGRSSLEKDIWGLVWVNKISDTCVGIVNKPDREYLKLDGVVRLMKVAS
jgi:hypothetical protein